MTTPITPNYGFNKPLGSDLMRDYAKLNENWDKVVDAPSHNSITGTLPQSGNYKLYDVVYRTNDQSSYILVVKDDSWGWHWRPVHAVISPWISLSGKNIYLNSSWNNVSATLSVAYDNTGSLRWRGTIVRNSPMIYNTTEDVFKDLPKGMYPARSTDFCLDVAPANLAGATGHNAVQFARFFFAGVDREHPFTPGGNAVRLFGGNTTGTQPNTIYMNFSYSIGSGLYSNY